MTTTVAVKLSADSGNQLSFGTDQGLMVQPATSATGGTYGWTIDNGWAASAAQWYYLLPASNSPLTTVASAQAQVWPFVVTRTCRVTDAQIYVSVAGAAGSTLNVSVFQANGTHGLPGTKITDLLRFPTSATGFIRPTVTLNDTQVFTGNTFYWMASWPSSAGAYPNMYLRSASNIGLMGIRQQVGSPTSAAGYGLWGVACVDSTAGWSTTTTAPASLNVTAFSGGNTTASNYSVPQIMWGLTNS